MRHNFYVIGIEGRVGGKQVNGCAGDVDGESRRGARREPGKDGEQGGTRTTTYLEDLRGGERGEVRHGGGE